MADPQSPTLQPPGGGSTVDPMIEARFATLEADVRHIRDGLAEVRLDLREVRFDLQNFRAETQSESQKLRAEMYAGFTELRVNFATLAERVNHLPTKGYIGWWITSGMIATVAALTILSRLGLLVVK